MQMIGDYHLGWALQDILERGRNGGSILSILSKCRKWWVMKQSVCKLGQNNLAILFSMLVLVDQTNAFYEPFPEKIADIAEYNT